MMKGSPVQDARDLSRNMIPYMIWLTPLLSSTPTRSAKAPS